MALEDTYRAYLQALNERRLDDLAEFVHDSLTYNDEPLTREQYAAMIAPDLTAAPDLYYDATILVATDTQIACRIQFDVTPQSEFLGFPATGTRLVFAEHVFYDFTDNRIKAVTSLIDRWAVHQQLGR
ncbi:ester cyclase [Actinoplanes sp. TRM 88003]|uniref:Ester cyclase n=1 Tax=Paractinoplanes aksuensis TaxID=2939490 RepID=A0ABT1DYJ9_9ACTN|nr:ester cyclase [Actinoplanes aksuensis]MCO8275835.1 ester cyclase [Actinoplanes aksuensis]